ncbi:MAG: DUF5714 domain-containing protein [Bacillota bacterium]|jgi:hypothetical protein
MNNQPNNKNNCLICGAEIVYSATAEELECAFCHQKFMSEAKCANGHYICDQCHSKPGLDFIMDYCLQTKSKNPVEITSAMMKHPAIHMHGPEHHVLFPSALLTAYHNAGGEIDLPKALKQAQDRGKRVPGGICGLWGSCGAGIGSGIFFSIAAGSSPMKNQAWGLSNIMTSKCLEAIGRIGGPRCCKRDGYTAILTAIDYTEETLGVQMEKPREIICDFTELNKECIRKRCPYNDVNHK